MAQRVERIVGHLSPSSKPAELTTGLASKAGSAASDDDVVIVSALRTPIGRGKRGNLKVRVCLLSLRCNALSGVVEFVRPIGCSVVSAFVVGLFVFSSVLFVSV